MCTSFSFVLCQIFWSGVKNIWDAATCLRTNKNLKLFCLKVCCYFGFKCTALLCNALLRQIEVDREKKLESNKGTMVPRGGVLIEFDVSTENIIILASVTGQDDCHLDQVDTI